MNIVWSAKQTKFKKTTDNNIQLTLATSESLLDFIKISSKAFGDSVENTTAWLKNDEFIFPSSLQCPIAEKVIGTITVSKQEQSTTLSGFAVHPSYQGKGYGKIFL